MSKIINSESVVFMDITDNRKLDVYIKSNLPTVQIRNLNIIPSTYTPDWSSTPLVLEADVYLDSQSVTNQATVSWYKKDMTGIETKVATNTRSLTINTNDLDTCQLIVYVCRATYKIDDSDVGIEAVEQITFSQVSTGKDGTSVNIKGTASAVNLNNSDKGEYWIQVDGKTHYASASSYGDAYIYSGYLYVRTGEIAMSTGEPLAAFIKVGQIQGPKGEDAKNIILTSTSQVIKVGKDGAYTPGVITVNSTVVNTVITEWAYSINGGEFQTSRPNGVVGYGAFQNVFINTLDSNVESISIRASDGTYSDVVTIYKVYDGVDGSDGEQGESAPMAFLTNENISFSANAGGQVSTVDFSTNVVAYNGAIKVTPEIGEITGLPSGMTLKSTVINDNEQVLTFNITDNSTLGSILSNNGTITIPVTSPANTNLVLSWSKINTGATGATGSKGDDAYTVLLTNESHTFAGSNSTAIASETTTQVVAYHGTTEQRVRIKSVNGISASTSNKDTGITGLQFKCSSISATYSPVITFTCTTGFTSQNGTIPIVVQVGDLEFTKLFTYSIAFKGDAGLTGPMGADGLPATAYWLISSASVIHKTSAGTITVTPSVLTLTGKSQTGTNTPVDYACRWVIDYSTDGTTYTNLATSTINEASKTVSVATTYKTVRVRMYMAGNTTVLLDEQIIPIVSDGAKGDQGVQGPKGDQGEQLYTWIKYADTPTSGMSNDPAGKTYIGLAYNKTTATESSTYSDYMWSLIKGETGPTGPKGNDGQQYYTWIKYADNASGANMSDSPTGKLYIGLAYNKTTSTESNVSTDYTWALFKGDKGETGAAGADAYTVLLTNESHVFAGSTSAAIASSATTQVLSYKGTASQSATIVSVNGVAASTSSTATGIAGLSFQCNALSGTSPTITFTCTTAFVSPNGTIPIVIKVGGISITKMFTYSIAFKGATGGAGSVGPASSSYWLVANADAVQKTTSGDILCTPATVTFAGKIQTGTGTPTDYACRWIIAYTTDGTTYTDLYTSTANEASTSVAAGITYKALRARMYLAGGTTTLLDEQIIPFVSDGAIGVPGNDAVTFQVYSSNGYALSTNTPTVTLQTFAYIGDVAITSGATYQWYSYNNGWSAISGATLSYLDVSRTDVSFSKSYMCKMIFGGIEYTGVATIDDKNDTNKVFTSKPSNYTLGDLWIVGMDYIPNGVEVGTLLRTEHTNATYADSDWITATKYDEKIDALNSSVEKYDKYFSFDSQNGLKISARDANGNASQFSTTLSNERLSFNQGTDAVAYIESNKMKIKEAEIISPLTVTGQYSGSTMLQSPIINIGNFSIVVESNGSLSIIANT